MKDQYNKLVQQNKDLQKELQLNNKMIELMLSDIMDSLKSTSSFELKSFKKQYEQLALSELVAEQNKKTAEGSL